MQINLERQRTMKWGLRMVELIASEVFKAAHGCRVGANRIMVG